MTYYDDEERQPDKVILYCQKCGKRISKEEAIMQRGLQVGKNCCWTPQTFMDKMIYKSKG
jgi:hypothetical protein